MAHFVRGVFALFTSLFVWAAYLQLNDGEPLLWMAIYGSAAIICGLGTARIRTSRWVGFGHALLMVAGAGYLAWQIYGVGEVTAMYGEDVGREAGLVALKEGREMLGLLVVAAATGGYGLWASGGDRDL